jgi:hypothetical protein
MRPFYAAAFALYPMYAPQPVIDDDFPYNAPPSDTPDAETRGIDANNQLHLACRFDYPSAAGDAWWRALEMQNTFDHEIGGHGFKAFLYRYEPNVDWNEQLWQVRGFPGTYAQASTANVPYRWDHDPNEVWGETGGAALAGAWTKPEKTYNYGFAADPLVMRASFREWMYQARPDLRPVPPSPSPVHSIPASWLGPLPPTNYRRGRRIPIDTVVFHHMAGFLVGTNLRFHDPTAGVSATYGVPHNVLGLVYEPFVQWVSETDTAYHAAGDSIHPAIDTLINDRSIGVEVEDLAADDFTEDQYVRCAFVARTMHDVYGVPLTRGSPGVLGHREVAGVLTACPGTLDIDRILALATGGLDVDEATLRRIIREEATTPLSDKLNAGFNVTMVAMLRRIGRYVKLGFPRDPAGDHSTTPPSPYPDDNTPLG